MKWSAISHQLFQKQRQSIANEVKWRETPKQHQVALASADLTQLTDEELENIIRFYRNGIGETALAAPHLI